MSNLLPELGELSELKRLMLINASAKPNHTPQHGKLVGLTRKEVCVELENGLREHFPRIGTIVKKA